jgi:hypothetical protein
VAPGFSTFATGSSAPIVRPSPPWKQGWADLDTRCLGPLVFEALQPPAAAPRMTVTAGLARLGSVTSSAVLKCGGGL